MGYKNEIKSQSNGNPLLKSGKTHLKKKNIAHYIKPIIITRQDYSIVHLHSMEYGLHTYLNIFMNILSR